MDSATASQKFQESKTLFASGDYLNSLKLLEEVDRAFPNQKNIMYARGLCLKNLGRTDEAIAVCQSALSRFEDVKIQALLDELQRAPAPASFSLSDLLPPEIQMASAPTTQNAPPAPGAVQAIPGTAPAATAPLPHAVSQNMFSPAGTPPPMPAPPLAFLADPGTSAGAPPLPSLTDSAMLFDEPGFSSQTPTPQPYAAPRSNKRTLIIAAAVGVVLLLLVGFPIVRGLMKGDAGPAPDTMASTEGAQPANPGDPGAAAGGTPAVTAALEEAPAQIEWYRSFEDGMQVAQQYGRMAFVFITDESETARVVEETVLMDEEIRRLSQKFICIRKKYDPEEDADAELYAEYPEYEQYTKPPRIEIYHQDGYLLTELSSDMMTTENVLGAMAALQMFEEFGNIELPVGKLIFVTVVALLMIPWPLFITLFFSGKLPHDGFVNNYISVGGTAVVVALRIGSLIGIARAIVMLKDIYDMSIVDLVIFAALYFFYLLSYVVFMTLVLGHSVVEQLLYT